MKQSLYSAPGEEYLKHIELCREKFELVFPIFLRSLRRVLFFDDDNVLKDAFLKMILYHDLGKLTKKWQENLGTNRSLPSHSTLGACYLWKTLPRGLKEPISFAVLIHHTDRGLLGDNIERPAEQAILDGITDYDGNIIWHEGVNNLGKTLFPEKAKELTVSDLKDMAKSLRVWAQGDSFLEQHKRRLQSILCHHILKLCDISAAVERKEYKAEDDEDYFGGWLMVEEIRRYVESKKLRGEKWRK